MTSLQAKALRKAVNRLITASTELSWVGSVESVEEKSRIREEYANAREAFHELLASLTESNLTKDTQRLAHPPVRYVTYGNIAGAGDGGPP